MGAREAVEELERFLDDHASDMSIGDVSGMATVAMLRLILDELKGIRQALERAKP